MCVIQITGHSVTSHLNHLLCFCRHVLSLIRSDLHYNNCWKLNQMLLGKKVTHWSLTFSTLISISILRIWSLLTHKKDDDEYEESANFKRHPLENNRDRSNWTCVEKAVDKAFPKHGNLRKTTWTTAAEQEKWKKKILATRTLSCFKLRRQTALYTQNMSESSLLN